MSEVSISQLPLLGGTPLDNDVFPLVSNNITQKVTYSTLYNDISSKVVVGKYTPITSFNDSQTFLSNVSGNWQSTYTTVSTFSGSWGAAAAVVGLTLFREVSSTISPNNSTNVYALSVNSLSANVDAAFIAKGTGATIAQIPDNTATGGAKRGQYATDWQKSRVQSTQVASGNYSAIGGGRLNKATGQFATIAGGYGNTAAGEGATASGYSNRADADGATVGGGYQNYALSGYSTIGGGIGNKVESIRSTIGGGNNNLISQVSDYSTIGGGYGNTFNLYTEYSTIGGGLSNTFQESTDYSTIGGGEGNIAGFTPDAPGYSSYVTIGGGRWNNAKDNYSTIGGGLSNIASLGSVVAGGSGNNAQGNFSFIAGGQSNVTTLSNTFTLGSNITAVLADYTYVNNLSTPGDISSNTARVTSLTGTNTRVTNITGANALFTNLTGTNTRVTNITGTNALFTNLTGTNTTVTNIIATNTTVTNITATNTTSTTISAATYQGIQTIKAWVNFDGTGTIAGNNATLNAGASYNINFVRKTGIGTYTVVFASSFANTNYIMSGSCSSDRSITPVISAGGYFSSPSGTTKTTLSCVVMMLSGATSATKADSKDIGLMFIGS